MADPAIAAEFLAYARETLMRQYWPRLKDCVERLNPEQLWWRAHDSSNSVGNLLLHLEGNVRQWILSGLGGAPDARRRQAEFDRRQPIAAAELLAPLEATLAAADQVLAAMTAEQLLRRFRIQGDEVSGLEAVFHVVEHFSTHLGQVVYVTKMLLDLDLGFYRYLQQADAGQRKP